VTKFTFKSPTSHWLAV